MASSPCTDFTSCGTSLSSQRFFSVFIRVGRVLECVCLSSATPTGSWCCYVLLLGWCWGCAVTFTIWQFMDCPWGLHGGIAIFSSCFHQKRSTVVDRLFFQSEAFLSSKLCSDHGFTLTTICLGQVAAPFISKQGWWLWWWWCRQHLGDALKINGKCLLAYSTLLPCFECLSSCTHTHLHTLTLCVLVLVCTPDRIVVEACSVSANITGKVRFFPWQQKDGY